jgi:hypothetical protein
MPNDTTQQEQTAEDEQRRRYSELVFLAAERDLTAVERTELYYLQPLGSLTEDLAAALRVIRCRRDPTEQHRNELDSLLHTPNSPLVRHKLSQVNGSCLMIHEFCLPQYATRPPQAVDPSPAAASPTLAEPPGEGQQSIAAAPLADSPAAPEPVAPQVPSDRQRYVQLLTRQVVDANTDDQPELSTLAGRLGFDLDRDRGSIVEFLAIRGKADRQSVKRCRDLAFTRGSSHLFNSATKLAHEQLAATE